jgi:hypothetical protein
MADAQFSLGFSAKLNRIANAAPHELDNELGHSLFRFRPVVRVRDGFAATVERVRHNPHGVRLKRSSLKGCDVDHGGLLCFRGGSAIGLSATDAWSELPSDDYTVRLFNPYVSLIIGEKLFPEELDQYSNVIKDHGAGVASMREQNDHGKSSCDTAPQRDKPDLSLSLSGEPAPIDIAAFGKRLGEIITKAIRASRKRRKSRT